MENDVKITIKSSALNYEGQTSIAKAAQVIAFLSQAVPTNDANQAHSSNNELMPNRFIGGSVKVSPRQIILDTDAKVNADKIAAFIYYLANYLNKGIASIQEIKDLFSKAGEPLPKNFARDLKDAVRSNYIFESSEGLYEITEYGREAVDKKFALEHVVKSKTGTRRPKPKALEIKAEVSKVEISSSEEGYPAFHSLNKGQQILWICCVLDEKYKIQELNMKEICFLIDRLKGNVTTGTFTALNDANMKKGYLKLSSNNAFKVTQPGIDRLNEIGKKIASA